MKAQIAEAVKVILWLLLILFIFGWAQAHAATPPAHTFKQAKVTNVVIMNTDYCHPIHRHSKWWTCDGVSLARWLHDNPVAPKGVHPVAAR